jgi:hypothetical protein
MEVFMSDKLKFARIVEVDGEQVLFYIEPDHESKKEGREKLHQIIRINGICADVALGGMTPEAADKALAKCDEPVARGVIEMVRKALPETLANA